MIFWIAILAGALFAWVAVRIGFYETWALLFNIIISVYVSIFLAPTVAQFVSSPGEGSWSTALSMFVLAGGCFAILHGLSYVFLTGQFSVKFPALFDVVFSGILGFVAGFLILSFAALALATTPLSENKLVSTLGLGRNGQQANIAGIARCCDLIHSVAGFADAGTTQTAVARLLEMSDRLTTEEKSLTDNDESSATNPPQAQPHQPTDDTTETHPRRRTVPAEPPNE